MSGNAAASFAQLLKEYRQAAGLTQEELAERGSVSARTISDLERGCKLHPYPRTVRQLTQALALEEGQASEFRGAARHVEGTVGESREAPESGVPTATLPLQPTSFIGRQRELRELSQVLCRGTARLLTLTGPGGVGKTRLALQVAEDVLDHFPDGVVFVSLASLADPGQVSATIASALSIREMSPLSPLDVITLYFRSKKMLLVLDNFEHLLSASDVVSHLMASCPHLRSMVTSRTVLHLAAERAYPVIPLAAPTPEHLPNVSGLSRYDAVLLFEQRAQAVKPDFHLSEENAAVIAGICWRLDGLPLAIELAAARIRVLPPRALLVLLVNRMQVLIGGPKDVPNRQQTLQNTIDWSYSLLTQDGRSLFARLSVFAGGCTLEAAEAVCNAEGDLDILDGITSLVDTSLLRRAGDDEERFSMLETLREYAVARLEESGNADAIRSAHAGYFYRMIGDVELELVGPHQVAWMRGLDREIDNIRAALTWHLDHGRADAVLQMTGNLWRYWDSRALFDEGWRWLSAGLTATGGEDPVGRTYQHLGMFVWRQGNHEEAKRLLERDLERALQQGDNMTVAAIWSTLGLIATQLGDYDEALRLHEASVALRRSLGDGRFVAHSLSCLGVLMLEQHRYEEAKGHLVEAIKLSRDAGDAWFHGIELSVLGFAVLAQGDDSRALQLFQESLRTLHELEERREVIQPLRGAIAVASIRGQPIRAARLAGALDGRGPSLGRAERHLATARSSLDPQTWNKEWEAGRAMSLEEAISYALEEDE